jgi:hypothetical protein
MLIIFDEDSNNEALHYAVLSCLPPLHVPWIQDTVQWMLLMNPVINLGIPLKAMNFLVT